MWKCDIEFLYAIKLVSPKDLGSIVRLGTIHLVLLALYTHLRTHICFLEMHNK